MNAYLKFWRAGAAALSIVLGAPADGSAMRLHFASNGNFTADRLYSPGRAGFNLADVASANELAILPTGVKGLAWVGRCDGVDDGFLEIVRSYLGRPNLFGFYLIDDPTPPNGYLRHCAAENLKAESDWIHKNLPTAKTFIVLMNAGSSGTPSFADDYRPANSHVDLFGFSPYPCRTELNGCDFGMIDRFVAAAKASGIPRERMVPVFQAFGGGDWRDDGGGRYLLPTPAQEQEILARWDRLVPLALFDYAYSWGAQRGDVALGAAFDLQTLFAHYNNAR